MRTEMGLQYSAQWRTLRNYIGLALIGVLLIAVSLTVQASVADAGTAVTLYVDNTLGNAVSGCTTTGIGACETVQQGITAAEAYGNSDVTVLVAAGTYNEHDTISVPGTDTLIIQGAGASTTTINAGSGGSVILVNAGTVTVAGLTITGGNASNGGGIYGDGTTTIENDTITNNSAGVFGGGIYIAGTATIEDDTISNNVTGSNGGAAYMSPTSTVALENDTISNNFASGYSAYADGVYNSGNLSVVNDTFVGSHNGPQLTTSGGVITISNSIFVDAYCENSGGSIVDGLYNVTDGSNSCGFGSFDTINSSTINLASTLAANGSSGPQTYAIGTNSSAFKEVPTANCTLTTDERGDSRPGILGQYCDAGAFEYQQPPTPTTTTTTTTTTTLPPTTTTLTTIPDRSVPGELQIRVVSTSKGSISISVAGTTQGGGSPNTRYQCSLNAQSWFKVSKNSHGFFVISHLASGKTYSVRLRALNGVGAGVSSRAVKVKVK